MKLTLEKLRELTVLKVAGEISSDELNVLKAGIQKFFRDGKNKIVLDISEVPDLTTPVIREVAILNILAAELAGSVIFAGVKPNHKIKLQAFSKPASFKFFESVQSAKDFLLAPPQEIPPEFQQKKPALPSESSPPEAAPAHDPREIELLKRMLENQLDKLQKPLSDTHANSLIQSLKDEVKTLTEKLQTASAPKAS